MTKQEMDILKELIEYSSQKMVDSSCNDYDLTKLMPDPDQRRNLIEEMLADDSKLNQFLPNLNYKEFYDWWLLNFLFKKLLKELPTMPPSYC